MLVNQLQRDINSTNHLEACAALSAVCKIVNEDMIPAVIGDVLKVLRHDVDAVRRKAVCALHRLYQLDKTCCIDHVEKVRRMICDKDPSVMGASLGLLHAMIVDSPSRYNAITHPPTHALVLLPCNIPFHTLCISFKDLVPSLVSILKQVADHRLPREYDYHRVPAPWIQMHLLRMLAVLGRGDRAASEGTYEVILEIMRKADTGVNVGYAIVFEAVQVTTLSNPVVIPNLTSSRMTYRLSLDRDHHLSKPCAAGCGSHVHQSLHPQRVAQPQVHRYQGPGSDRKGAPPVRGRSPDGRHRLPGGPRRDLEAEDPGSTVPHDQRRQRRVHRREAAVASHLGGGHCGRTFPRRFGDSDNPVLRALCSLQRMVHTHRREGNIPSTHNTTQHTTAAAAAASALTVTALLHPAACHAAAVLQVFELAGDKVKPSVAQTLMQLIAGDINTYLPL